MDTNIVASLYVPNNMDEWVYKVLDVDEDWVTPPLWKSEFTSVLSKYLRHRIFDLTHAQHLLKKAQLFMKSKVVNVRMERVIELVSQSTCSSYDCEFVSLAQELDIPLVTWDKKILQEFPSVAMTPQTFIG